MRLFSDYQVVIVYHDDNQNQISHAHLIVNCTNLVTGNRLHTDNPFELNRALQDMARERGLSGLSNVMERHEGLSHLAAKDEPEKAARTMQPTYMSWPERELVDSGGYSWVADIPAAFPWRRGSRATKASSEASWICLELQWRTTRRRRPTAIGSTRFPTTSNAR